MMSSFSFDSVVFGLMMIMTFKDSVISPLFDGRKAMNSSSLNGERLA